MLRKAQKSKAKIRVGLAGPSGSGKTMTALLMAYGLCGDWTKIAIIDSEQGSADLYEHLGPYNVFPISAPFTPEKYINALADCIKEGMEVVIEDSITHEWNGKGGCLDIHEQVTSKMRIPNSFTAWAQVTPRHQAFVDSILQSPTHMITTVRSKTDYVLAEKNGKQVPEKVGMQAQTRDGFEYELTIAFDLDLQHKAFTSKDRTGLFMDKPSFIINSDTGKLIKEWCEKGVEPTIEPPTLEELMESKPEPKGGKIADKATLEQVQKLLKEVPKNLQDSNWKAIDQKKFILTEDQAGRAIVKLGEILATAQMAETV